MIEIIELEKKEYSYIRIHTSEENYQQYLIERGRKWTPCNCCVEYADYYEIAMHSWYTRIDKNTLEITSNLYDVYVYEKMTNRWAVLI
jgi:hypothetical protein